MSHTDRFDYAGNLARAGSYRDHRGAFWPPAETHLAIRLDLDPAAPDLGQGLPRSLAALRDAVDAQWRAAKETAPERTRFADPGPVAAALRGVGDCLPVDVDRLAVALRAKAIEDGYDDDLLKALADIEEDVAVVAGQLATWYGKQLGGLPTAFACRRDDERQRVVAAAAATTEDIASYLASLHADLRLGDVPAFAATRIFFMAGEGNTHPKHIAYFLPEDEGVKRSPFKKTYYFGNTHRRLLAHQSAPLAARFLRVGATFDPAAERFTTVPVLGVLGHEFGHCVHRPGATYRALNAAERWASVTLQETAADVFGVLLLAEVWAERMGVAPADALAYYLAECLRYVNRGLGHFPDSDGMFLQLAYYVRVGALTVDREGGEPVLASDPGTVLAGVRSLARVLADALLAGAAEPAVALHRTYGPASAAAQEALAPFVDALRRLPAASVEYAQDYVSTPAGPLPDEVRT